MVLCWRRASRSAREEMDRMSQSLNLEDEGIFVRRVLRNPAPAVLYEDAIAKEHAAVMASGALATRSGRKTGRSPQDKRVLEHPASVEDIWWGDVNIKLGEQSFLTNRQRALDFFNQRDMLYVVDGYAGWDPRHRLKVRVICSRAYHALFMHNLLIRPTAAELTQFTAPNFTIYNAGEFYAMKHTPGMTSTTSIALSFERGEVVILGTQYAGEMKKAVFTIMNYVMPKRGVLSMHCSANEGSTGDVALFFGLSGTGKTTLSADSRRRLIGDDEHCWSNEGVFNIEGGCYAKCVHLSPEKEPEIHQAIRFGAVLENVVYNEQNRQVDYSDASITENTRAAYPIEFIPNAKIPCTGVHPRNIFFLTCDAFGILPPVSRLTPAQTMYHFLSGYTAKVAGTEVGVMEPQATFSACFGAPFLVWHPTKYAEMLATKMRAHDACAWLINTGWSGGAFGQGQRMALRYTRAIIDAIHSGALQDVPYDVDPLFGLHVPKSCPNVPNELLVPRNTWRDANQYDQIAGKLAGLFRKNFARFESFASEEVRAAGPRG